MENLRGKKIAILVADGFEQSELEVPRQALIDVGAQTFVVSPAEDMVKGWREKSWGTPVAVDLQLSEADANEFDGLLLPGGVMNPDKLRDDDEAVRFIEKFVEDKKPIAAICHGPWTLINAGGVEGKRMTSYSSIRADLENAGARWEDSPVVVDRGLVTSRSPKDFHAFIPKMIEEFGEGIHDQRHYSGHASGRL